MTANGREVLVQKGRLIIARNRDLSAIVIGAGLAGLTAAHKLQDHGFRITVLEADKNHIGGRARTIRFPDGSYAEAGAMRIPAHHHFTRQYVERFGLSLRKFVQSNPSGFVKIRNSIARSRPGPDFRELFATQSPETEGNPGRVWDASITKLVDALTDEEKLDIFRDDPITSTIRKLDTHSLISWLMNEGISDEAIQMLASAWNLESSLHSSLLAQIRSHLEGTWINNFDEVVGGTDRLPMAMADELDEPVQLGSVVKKIIQSKIGVTVCYHQGRSRKEAEADFVVCTSPLKPTRLIEFEPKLDVQKSEAMRRVNYDSSTKVIGHAARRFWEIDDGIYGGGSIDDEVLISTWYPNDNLAQDPEVSSLPSAFTASYSWGQQARLNINNARKIKLALAQLHEGLRTKPNDLLRLVPWSWDRFPFSKGAYAHFLPGEHTILHSELSRPEGRIHFAGEHTSLDHAWMQGAISSGIRAAEEILDTR